MAQSKAISGMGVTLKVGDGAEPEVFSVVSEVRSFGDLSFDAETADVTHMQSPGGMREFITTVVEGGDIPIECNFVPNDVGHAELRDAVFNRERKNFLVTFPTTPEINWLIHAAVIGYSINVSHDDRIPLTITIKPSGAPEFMYEPA